MPRRTRRVRNTRGPRDGLVFFCFVIVIALGAALATVLTLNVIYSVGASSLGLRSAARWVERVAIALAISIPIVLSFREVRRRNSTAWLIVWIIAVVLIVVVYFLNIVGGLPRVGWWPN